MLAQPEIDERVADLTEHEFDPACDGIPRVEQCDHTATVAGLFSCGHDRLWCDEHHKSAVRDEKFYGCLSCMTCPEKSPFVRIVHIEPLHGH